MIHVLVFDGFADWEPSYALAELRRSGNHEIVAVGFTADEVTSMGGLRVRPDRALADVRAEQVRLLVLPGGDMWEREDAYPPAQLEALIGAIVGAARPPDRGRAAAARTRCATARDAVPAAREPVRSGISRRLS